MPRSLAVVVGGEEVADRAEAGGLDVDRLRRRPGHRLDVGDRVDRRVPGDPLGDRLEQRPGLVGDVGVLEPGLGEGLDQLRVELGVGLDVDRGAFVEALEVERVDGAGLDQRGDQLVVPVVGRVELEAQGRVDGEAGEQRLDRGALLAAQPASRIELTKLTGRGSRPSAAARLVPAWRSARSSAADSKAQRR